MKKVILVLLAMLMVLTGCKSDKGVKEGEINVPTYPEETGDNVDLSLNDSFTYFKLSSKGDEIVEAEMEMNDLVKLDMPYAMSLVMLDYIGSEKAISFSQDPNNSKHVIVDIKDNAPIELYYMNNPGIIELFGENTNDSSTDVRMPHEYTRSIYLSIYRTIMLNYPAEDVTFRLHGIDTDIQIKNN